MAYDSAKEAHMAGPFLIGRRIHLRAFEETDAPILAKWINEPTLRSFILQRFPQTLQNEKEWIASLYAKKPPSDLAFGVELIRGKRLIGSVGLHMINWVQRRAMTGIFLSPESMRGKGYGSEAKNLVIDYAFGELGMESLWAIAFVDNVASNRALLKQGYRKQGVFRRSALVNGRWVDSNYYDIVREEWEKKRRNKK
jgi:RimJ/RimL family protein N-acetyltransferase